MDSRISEAIQTISDKAHFLRMEMRACGASNRADTLACEIRGEALAILTAEPEPCEDVEKIVLETLNGLYWCGRVWSAWSVGTMSEDDFIAADKDDTIVSEAIERFRTYASRREQAAMEDERIRCVDRAIEWYDQTDDPIQSQRDDIRDAILQGTEPAKASEDVERDIETVRHSLSHVHAIKIGDDSIFEDGVDAFDRLVSRLKEWNHG